MKRNRDDVEKEPERWLLEYIHVSSCRKCDRPNFHSFAFLVPATPVTSSPLSKKSGYWNPAPGLDWLVRQAPPSTATPRQRNYPPFDTTAISAKQREKEKRVHLTNKGLAVDKVARVSKQIHRRVGNLLDSSPSSYRYALAHSVIPIRLFRQPFHALRAHNRSRCNDVTRQTSGPKFNRRTMTQRIDACFRNRDVRL